MSALPLLKVKLVAVLISHGVKEVPETTQVPEPILTVLVLLLFDSNAAIVTLYVAASKVPRVTDNVADPVTVSADPRRKVPPGASMLKVIEPKLAEFVMHVMVPRPQNATV